MFVGVTLKLSVTNYYDPWIAVLSEIIAIVCVSRVNDCM